MTKSSPTLNSGRPLKPGEADRLGFRQIAEKLAAAIVAQSASDGLVLAIEGSWGSGKSSMVTLLKVLRVHALVATPLGNEPQSFGSIL